MQIAAPQRRAYGTLRYVERDGRQGTWILDAAPQLAVRVKRLLPRVLQHRTGEIHLVNTPEIARDLEWIVERYPLDMDPATHAQLTTHADRSRAIESDVLAILNGKRVNTGVRVPAREPYPEQLQSADLAMTTGRLLLTDDTGLGKSFTALLLLRAADSLPALVVTLTHLPEQWVDKELTRSFPDLRGHIINSTTVYDPSEDGQDPDVLVISYSKLAAWADYLVGNVKTVIFDEVQELRHPGTDKYNAAARIAAAATYRLGLSATPVYNYTGEIFNILDVLEQDCLGSRAEFEREWGGEDIGNGRIKVRDPHALGEHLRAQGLMHGHTREQVGRPLPEPVVAVQPVDADPDVYRRMSGDAVEMARFVLDRANHPSARWQQAGQLDLRLRQATGLAKAPFVAAFCQMLLESGTERLVLWGWHRAVYDVWRTQLAAYRPAMYTGSETSAQKLKAVKSFLYGDARILIMSLRSGAGLDGLQMGCDTCVFGELDWSPQVHVQCIGRLGRDGITEPPKAFFCVSDYGADPPMLEVLDVKRLQNDAVIDRTHATIQPAAPSQNHIRALAESVLARAGVASVA